MTIEPFPTLRILVTGSRDWTDDRTITEVLAYLAERHGQDVTLIHGACPTGADAIADGYGVMVGWTIERYPADWRKFGKSAGWVRNRTMVTSGADMVLAFIRNGSRGATMTADLAQIAGLPVYRYEV